METIEAYYDVIVVLGTGESVNRWAYERKGKRKGRGAGKK